MKDTTKMTETLCTSYYCMLSKVFVLCILPKKFCNTMVMLHACMHAAISADQTIHLTNLEPLYGTGLAVCK